MSTPHAATRTRLVDERDATDTPWYELTLFVSGASDLSARAIANTRRLCDSHLAGRHQLLVVDVHEDLAAVLENQVVAAPTLIKTLPLPVRKLVGDLSQTDRVLEALDLPPARNASRTVR
jgi:circadian clock protein KaiB